MATILITHVFITIGTTSNYVSMATHPHNPCLDHHINHSAPRLRGNYPHKPWRDDCNIQSPHTTLHCLHSNRHSDHPIHLYQSPRAISLATIIVIDLFHKLVSTLTSLPSAVFAVTTPRLKGLPTACLTDSFFYCRAICPTRESGDYDIRI